MKNKKRKLTYTCEDLCTVKYSLIRVCWLLDSVRCEPVFRIVVELVFRSGSSFLLRTLAEADFLWRNASKKKEDYLSTITGNWLDLVIFFSRDSVLRLARVLCHNLKRLQQYRKPFIIGLFQTIKCPGLLTNRELLYTM